MVNEVPDWIRDYLIRRARFIVNTTIKGRFQATNVQQRDGYWVVLLASRSLEPQIKIELIFDKSVTVKPDQWFDVEIRPTI